MQMISFLFLGLTAFTWAALYLADRFLPRSANTAAKLILLAASYLVILWADIRFAAVLGAMSLSTWYFGQKKQAAPGIVLALAALGFFKYTNFFAESFARLVGADFNALNIILPLGISFYTFSAISYLADIQRGKQEARSLLDVALYLSFYPKLTSGPIQRSGDFFRQLDGKRELGWVSLSPGIQIFVFGLFKKIVLADRISVFVNQVFDTPLVFGSATVFFGAVCYALQIYFDFSGYSDMAIGIGRILGFDLPRNFNLPYLSRNVTELWKRWHMTLSSWLQDYLYIGLGGSRKGKLRTYCNLILTMVLGGIWHGPSWNYVVWGLLHGIALAVHKLWMEKTGSANKPHSPLANVLSVCITFLFTTFCWIFFRAETLGDALTYVGRIFAFAPGLEHPYLWAMEGLVILAVASVLAFANGKKLGIRPKKQNFSGAEGFYPILDLSKFWQLTLFFVFCGLLLCLAYTGGSPFIYGKY